MDKNNEQHVDLQLGLAYDRAMRQSRLFIYLFVISFILNIALIVAVSFMLPLKEVKPYFMPVTSAADQYYKIIPADKLTQHQLLELVRDYLKRYIKDRHTIDHVTETVRFKRIKAQSNDKVFAQVKDEYRQLQEHMEGVQRNIEIISDIQLEPYYHQLEFKTIDEAKDGRTSEKFWVVNIRYQLAGFNAPSMALNAEEMTDNPNPLGLIITGYAWTARRNVSKGE